MHDCFIEWNNVLVILDRYACLCGYLEKQENSLVNYLNAKNF